MKLLDILSHRCPQLMEDQTGAPPPAGSGLSQAEWDDMVRDMGEGEANRYVRLGLHNNDPRQQPTTQREKVPGEFGTKEYYASQGIKDRGDQLRAAMRTARGPTNTAPLRNNELAQIGQMSSIWHPKNDTENYQTDPGSVQLVDRNDANPQQNAGHPPQPQGSNQHEPTNQQGGDQSIQLARENGYQTVSDFYRALKMNVGNSNPEIATAAKRLLKQLQQNMVVSNVRVRPSTTPPPVPTAATPIRPAPPRSPTVR